MKTEPVTDGVDATGLCLRQKPNIQYAVAYELYMSIHTRICDKLGFYAEIQIFLERTMYIK